MVNRMSELEVTMVSSEPGMGGAAAVTHRKRGRVDETRTDPGHKTKDKQMDAEPYVGQTQVILLRGALAVAILVSLYYKDGLRFLSDRIYAYLLSTNIFNSVYFETYWATFCYAVIIPVYPWLVAKQPWLDKYKIDPSVKYVHTTVLKMIQEAVMYMSPLMLLDTFMVKKYCGVDPQIWEDKRKSFIQITRALPSDPPTVFQIAYQLIASFLLYDVLFFLLHLALHRNYFLYNYIHRRHHDHGTVHAHVTNQLTVAERITLVLSANFALKVFNSHPLTRTIFVPIFVFILVDNHTGYDMPFGLHRLVPFGLVGGALKHYQHHTNGARHYQPIMTYLDKLLEIYGNRKS